MLRLMHIWCTVKNEVLSTHLNLPQRDQLPETLPKPKSKFNLLVPEFSESVFDFAFELTESHNVREYHMDRELLSALALSLSVRELR